MNIIVYHASTEIVSKPMCFYGRPNLDFGRGFYVTDLKEQAERWAQRMSDRRRLPGIINVYRLDKEALQKEARCKIFDAYDKEWLRFICKCRTGYNVSEDFDYVEGGIANDRVVDSVNAYLQGLAPEDWALKRLAEHQPNNQICLLNQSLTDKFLHYERHYRL